MLPAVTSRDNAAVKAACQLRDSARARAEQGAFFAEGPKLCLELARGCTLRTLYTTAAALARTPALAAFDAVTVPISDPVAAKLVPEMGKAGKGVTGVSDLIPVEKQLDLIKAILPEATKIGILYNTSEPNSESQIATYNGAAGGYGFEIITSGVTGVREEDVLQPLRRHRRQRNLHRGRTARRRG